MLNLFRVTYTDGSDYTTQANGTLKEFTDYLMQFGGIVVNEDPNTGKETRRQIAKVEEVRPINHPFWKQFNDPARAYYNYIPALNHFRDHPDEPRPDDELDYRVFAWKQARTELMTPAE